MPFPRWDCDQLNLTDARLLPSPSALVLVLRAGALPAPRTYLFRVHALPPGTPADALRTAAQSFFAGVLVRAHAPPALAFAVGGPGAALTVTPPAPAAAAASVLTIAIAGPAAWACSAPLPPSCALAFTLAVRVEDVEYPVTQVSPTSPRNVDIHARSGARPVGKWRMWVRA